MSHLRRVEPPAEYVDAPPPGDLDHVVEVWEETAPRLATWDGKNWRCIGGNERVLHTVRGWREVPRGAKVLL